MKLIVNGSSMVPIYEQIVDQIKAMIVSGELKPDNILPSVRSLSKELKISALTVKKAYDTLESEADLEMAIQKGRRCGLKDEEIREMFELILED